MRRPVARRAELPATGDHASSAPTTPAPPTPARCRARARAAVARSARSYAARPVVRGERSHRHAVAATQHQHLARRADAKLCPCALHQGQKDIGLPVHGRDQEQVDQPARAGNA